MEIIKRFRIHITSQGYIGIYGYGNYNALRHLVIDEDNGGLEFLEVTTEYLRFYYKVQDKEFLLNFSDIDWSKPMTPSRMMAVRKKRTRFYAIYNLLAEASMAGFHLLDKVDLEALRKEYGEEMYEGIDMERFVSNVCTAIRKTRKNYLK